MVQSRFPAWLIAALLALVTIGVYWPITHFDFINLDDPDYFSANRHVLSGLKWDNVLWAFRPELEANWHPLTWLSFMLDVTLLGPGPRGPHLINLLLHTANSVLVFLLLRRMTGAFWRSVVVAGLFALHPLRVESVAWVTERKDVLSTFFFLLTLAAYVGYVRVQSLKSEVGRQRSEVRVKGSASRIQHPPSRVMRHAYLFYLLALCFFALGLMSKPMLVTLPLVLLLLDYWPLQRLTFPAARARVWQLIGEKAPFFLLSAVSCVVTFQAQSHAGAVADWVSSPLGARLQNAIVSYARYLGKNLWPVDLVIVYPLPVRWPWGAVAGATVLVVGLGLGVLWYGRQRQYLLTGGFWWFGTLLPVIGLAQAGNQAMADRYTYLPAIGLLVGLVWGAAELARSGRLPSMVTSIGAAAVLVGCCLWTAGQLRYWRDNETLFRHAVACTSGNFVAHEVLGVTLAAQGKWDEAIQQYELVLQTRPRNAEAHNNLGLALAAQRKWNEAIQHYEQALKSKPNLPFAHNNLGVAFAEQGKWQEASQHYEQALQSSPNLAEAHYNLGLALGAQGKWNEAIQHYEQALKSNPDLASICNPNIADAHNNLGTAFCQQGRAAEAVRQFQEALRLKPDHAEARRNLDAVLAAKAQASPPPGTSTNR